MYKINKYDVKYNTINIMIFVFNFNYKIFYDPLYLSFQQFFHEQKNDNEGRIKQFILNKKLKYRFQGLWILYCSIKLYFYNRVGPKF